MELRPAIEAVAADLEHSGVAVEGRARGHLGVVRRRSDGGADGCGGSGPHSGLCLILGSMAQSTVFSGWLPARPGLWRPARRRGPLAPEARRTAQYRPRSQVLAHSR